MLRHGPDDHGTCCPPPEHPPRPDIRAGLSTLVARQTLAFPTERRALLAAVGAHPGLQGWSADSPDDLGVMLLEAWAYVVDVIGFYDRLIAERSYLGTASDDAVCAALVSLTGHVPRPALVARVKLALHARGREAVLVPAATGFRSQPFGDETAQVFELAEPATAWPQRNSLPLAPQRGTAFDGNLRFLPVEGPLAGALISVASGALRHAARVLSSDVAVAADGQRYRQPVLEPPLPAAFTGVSLATLQLVVLALAAYPSPLVGTTALSSTYVVLDAVYPMVQASQPAVVEVNGVLHAVVLSGVSIYTHTQNVGSAGATAQIPFTKIEFASIGALPAGASARCHLVPKAAGQPTVPALTQLGLADLQSGGLLDIAALQLGAAPASGDGFALGLGVRGIALPGTLQPLPLPRIVPDAGGADTTLLETPVAVLGNVVTAVRGETVAAELLGSGQAQLASQRFTLKKKPLAWTEDAAALSGRAPQITLWVDGVAWAFVDTFYGRMADERVFTVEMAVDGSATVVGGDGVRGARFPSGVNNIVASYRHGAGAAKPPPGSITQFARAAPGLSRVQQPLDAWGGADAETAAEMRDLAPASSLTLGRAVSLADFEAMVRASSGIVNAAVAYTWDSGRQTAVVTAWVIADSGDPSEQLAAFLTARALPGLAIRVQLAQRIELAVFDVTVVAADGWSAETVRAAVRTALFDPAGGYLAPRNVPVAAPLLRSQLLAAIHAVPGVASVPSIALASGAVPKALQPGEGRWFDFLAHGQVL